MKYLDTKENSIEDSVTRVLMGEKKLDPVNPTAVKKKFDDRKDKDIDNDGDVDSTDKYLHKRRKAISKAIKNDKPNKLDEILPALAAIGTAKTVGKVAKAVGGDIQKKKNNNVRENVKDIAMMMRDKKYKGRTSAFDAAVKKKYPKEYDTNAVQALIRRHAEMNESIKNEGTWAMPATPKLKMGLKKALQRPIMLGKEGDDATDTIRSFIGDDELYDDLYAAGMKNPKGDARPIIKKHLKRLGIKEDVELDENYRKLAMKGIGTETKKGARVGLKTDYYLPSNGDKSFGKIMRVSKDGYEIQDEKTKKTYKFKFYDSMNDPTSVRGTRKENYDIGNDYAKHTLEVTPGQDKSDVDEMLGIMQKKSVSMREALAKVWGVDEGKSPFQKKEEKIKEKTLTGKKPTEVKVDPEIEVK